MDINITAIERNLRFYGAPAALTIFGLIGTLLIDPNPSGPVPVMILAPLAKGVFLACAAATAAGALWLGYRAVLEWRWQRGALDGGCLNCGGPMRHLDGRYGSYSKCMMCGSKREGSPRIL